MCQLKPAFHSTNMLTLAMQIVEAKYDALDEMWSDDLHGLVIACLSPDPAERPDIQKVSGMCGSRVLEYLDGVARQQASQSDMTASQSSYNISKHDESPSSLNSSTSSYRRPSRPKFQASNSFLPPINPAQREYQVKRIGYEVRILGRNHSMSAGETPRASSVSVVSLPRISDKCSGLFPLVTAALPNRRRVQTCSTEHPARSSSSTDLKVPKPSEGLSVSSNALRPIQDPVLTILTQIHQILIVTDKESFSTSMNHQRRLVEMFRKNLLGRESDVLQMKTHLRKLAAESPEEIKMNLGFSDFRPVLVQSNLNGYQKGRTFSVVQSFERMFSDQKVTKITYEQLFGCIQSLLSENTPVNT